MDPNDSVSQVGNNSKSFWNLPAPIRSLTLAAAKIITDYTLFQNPLPDGDETLSLIEDAWTQAQGELGNSLVRLKPADTYVCLIYHE